ncbi:putative PapD-like superfamily protein [Helianthus anomalus]
MDRLISLEPSNVVAIRLEQGQKCYGRLTLRNVMYTMPVAFQLQPMNKAGIISPLTTVTVEITYDFPPSSSLLGSLTIRFCYIAWWFLPGATLKIRHQPMMPIDWFTTRKKQVFVDSGIKDLRSCLWAR